MSSQAYSFQHLKYETQFKFNKAKNFCHNKQHSYARTENQIYYKGSLQEYNEFVSTSCFNKCTIYFKMAIGFKSTDALK